MRVHALISAMLLVSLPAVSAAEPMGGTGHRDGFYVGIGGGLNVLEDLTIPDVDTPIGPQPGGYVAADPGGVILGSLGWSFSNGLRFEVEGSFRSNGFEQATAGALMDDEAGGHQETTAIFANAFYDIDLTSLGLNTSVSPYIGAGIGYAWAKWDDVYVTNPNELVRHNDTDESLAWQAMVGVAAPIAAAPGLSLSLEYRVMGFVDDRSYDGRVERSPIGSFPITTNIEDGLNHSVLVGLRYAFGQ